MDMRVARGGRVLLVLLVLVLGVEVLIGVTALLQHGIRSDEVILLGAISATVVLSAAVPPIRVRRPSTPRAAGVVRGPAEA